MGLQQIPSKGGVPGGNTASRPSSPSIGDTFYNGELGILEIYTNSDWQPCSAPPSVPTSAIATDVGTVDYTAGGSLSVAFTTGIGGGLATQFTASTASGGFTANASSSPVVITGLTIGTAYTASVVAKNGFGNSISSNTTESITVTTKPQVPTIGTATGLNTSASVAFTAGATGGKSITNYKYSLDGTTYTAFSPAQTTSPLTISGLTNDTTYTVRIKAVNANGDSPASSASNSFTPTNTAPIEYLVVAGGGGGGNAAGANSTAGGGGAGGYRTNIGGTTLPLTFGVSYDVVIGAGGTGGSSGSGTSGGNSRLASIYATGGGYGGGPENNDGGNGGSGGGCGHGTNIYPGTGNAGGYTPVEGYDGGDGSGDGAGGGGGAGGVGTTSTSYSYNGPGGPGSNSCSAWATITSTGESGYYAGGGGGGAYEASNDTDNGGIGGGGDGKSRAGSGGAGLTNTGSGGGGAGGSTGSYGSGGNGGSGIVIMKYPAAYTPTFSGLTTNTTTSGEYKYTAITAGTGTVTF